MKQHGRKERDDRLAKEVSGFDSKVESRIIEGALRALHPVDDAGALTERLAGAANGDAGISGEMIKRQLRPLSRSHG
jgi:hypothetical protein